LYQKSYQQCSQYEFVGNNSGVSMECERLTLKGKIVEFKCKWLISY